VLELITHSDDLLVASSLARELFIPAVAHRPLVDQSQGQQSVVRGESARESEEQCQNSSRHPLWHKRETLAYLVSRRPTWASRHFGPRPRI
jgi:hypothetical protein